MFVSQPNYYYWYKGEKIPLELTSNKKFAFYSSEYADSAIAFFKERSWQVIKNGKDRTINTLTPFQKDIEGGKYNWAIIKKEEGENSDLFMSQLPDYILYIAPFFLSMEGDEAGLSHLFYVRLNKAEDINTLNDFAEENNVEIIGNNKFMPLWYTLACTKNSVDNAMEMANLFYESGKFGAAEPDLMVENWLQCVDDDYFTNQWNLNNTGQYDGTNGIDIQFCEAREITSGCSDIIIAIVDQGIEMDHPDLEDNIYAFSYDTESGTQPSQVLGSHGTACAGIAGASADNDEGIAGVASNCQLMSISNDLDLSLNVSQELANGINWAWHNGADVISNSWGSNGFPRNIIDEAIDSSLIYGRDGLGCVVVFAAGNDNTEVVYPANCNSDIIAVGAMSQCGERKSPSSCDGENWGSNYGDELDVVAPGVLVPTTDRQGNAGYNPNVPIHTNNGGDKITTDFSNQDYTVWFNGTSAATPHVAGVAALILSVNPYLTQDQVRDIIESTAQKVRTDLYTYSTTTGRTNGTWNNQMGYGLVDAYDAVIAAAGGPISGPIQVCTSGSTFSISPLAPFDSIHWNKGACLSISAGQGTTSCTFVANCYGSSYVRVTVYANGHGTTLPQKTVYAALATPPLFDVSGPGSIVLNSTEHYVADILPRDLSTYGIYYYDWSVTSKLQFESSHAYRTDAYIKGISLGFGTISFYTTNGCGTSTFNLPVRVVSSKSLSIYPNPASNEITIEIDEEANFEDTSSNLLISESIPDAEYLVTVYNNSGMPVFINKYLSVNEIRINTSSWQKGIYYVVLTFNEENYSGALIIE